jgi:hypothetical protein
MLGALLTLMIFNFILIIKIIILLFFIVQFASIKLCLKFFFIRFIIDPFEVTISTLISEIGYNILTYFLGKYKRFSLFNLFSLVT